MAKLHDCLWQAYGIGYRRWLFHIGDGLFTTIESNPAVEEVSKKSRDSYLIQFSALYDIPAAKEEIERACFERMAEVDYVVHYRS